MKNIYNKLSIAWIITYTLFICIVVFGVVTYSEAKINPEVQQLAQTIKEDFQRAEMYWLTLNIYHEARGENPFGMFMVALVTLERQNIGRWGDTIKDVVTYPHQFSWYSDGRCDIPTDEKSWKIAKSIAYLAKMTYSTFNKQTDITHYHNRHVRPSWSKKLKRAMVIGNHIFYYKES